MWLYFNNKGQLITSLEHGSPARVGSTNFEIFAVFEGISDATTVENCMATIKLIRPDFDSSSYPVMLMYGASAIFNKRTEENDTGMFTNGLRYYGFKFDFNELIDDNSTPTDITDDSKIVLLDTEGLWSAIITLITASDSAFNVQGLATFNVSGTGSEIPSDIPYDLITNQLIAQIQQKALRDQVIITIPNSDISVSVYKEGQLFYNRADGLVYILHEGALIVYSKLEYVVDANLSLDSVNPVTNRAVTEALMEPSKKSVTDRLAKYIATFSNSIYQRMVKFDNKLWIFADRKYFTSIDNGQTWSARTYITTAETEPMPDDMTPTTIGNAFPYILGSTLHVVYRCHDENSNYYSLRDRKFDTSTQLFGNPVVMLANYSAAGVYPLRVDNTIKGLWEPVVNYNSSSNQFYLEYSKESTEYPNETQKICSRRLNQNAGSTGNVTALSGEDILYPYCIDGRRFGCLCSVMMKQNEQYLHLVEDAYGGSGENTINIRGWYTTRGIATQGSAEESFVIFQGTDKVEYIAPYGAMLPDGRLLLVVHTNRDYLSSEDVVTDNINDRCQYKLFVSKQPIVHGTPFTEADLEELDIYSFARNEYSKYGCVSVIDNNVYCCFERAFNTASGTKIHLDSNCVRFPLGSAVYNGTSIKLGNTVLTETQLIALLSSLGQ